MIPFATSGGYLNHSMTLSRTVDMRDLLVCYGHAGFFVSAVMAKPQCGPKLCKALPLHPLLDVSWQCRNATVLLGII